MAAAAGADTPADVVEQRDQHAQHQVQGPRLRLEVSSQRTVYSIMTHGSPSITHYYNRKVIFSSKL